MEEGVIGQLNSSGRLSLNRTLRNQFDLVIYEVPQSDTGTYSCTIDVGYWKQHVTALNVTAGMYAVMFPVIILIRYVTSHLGQLSLPSPEVGKSSRPIPVCLAGG